MRTIFLGLAVGLLSVSAAVAEPAGDGVKVTDAWARASAGAASNGAAYVTLTGGKQADSLTGASTPVADMTMVHQSAMQGGQMHMSHVDALAVPAGQTVMLSPGGYHIMLMGLHKPLQAGDQFPLTLTFAHTQPTTVTVTVRALAGSDQMGSGQMGTGHTH